VRYLELEDEDCDEDRKDTVAECLEPGFIHRRIIK
jgi:hypothetical protein